jgi:hypothetical protein
MAVLQHHHEPYPRLLQQQLRVFERSRDNDRSRIEKCE